MSHLQLTIATCAIGLSLHILGVSISLDWTLGQIAGIWITWLAQGSKK